MKRLIKQVEEKKIDYRIMQYENNHMRLLVDIENKKRLMNLLSEKGFFSMPHPKGKSNGFEFVYRLNEFLYYKRGEEIIELMFQVPCMSLTPNVWIPLDKCIQKRAWDDVSIQDGLKYLPEDVQMIYLIVVAIFEERGFSEEKKDYINARTKVLREDITMRMLRKVFFSFTDVLVEKISCQMYDTLFQDYVKYKEY